MSSRSPPANCAQRPLQETRRWVGSRTCGSLNGSVWSTESLASRPAVAPAVGRVVLHPCASRAGVRRSSVATQPLYMHFQGSLPPCLVNREDGQSADNTKCGCDRCGRRCARLRQLTIHTRGTATGVPRGWRCVCNSLHTVGHSNSVFQLAYSEPPCKCSVWGCWEVGRQGRRK